MTLQTPLRLQQISMRSCSALTCSDASKTYVRGSFWRYRTRREHGGFSYIHEKNIVFSATPPYTKSLLCQRSSVLSQAQCKIQALLRVAAKASTKTVRSWGCRSALDRHWLVEYQGYPKPQTPRPLNPKPLKP